MILSACGIHLYGVRVERCPICAAVLEEIRERAAQRTPHAIAATRVRARQRAEAKRLVAAGVIPQPTRRKGAA